MQADLSSFDNNDVDKAEAMPGAIMTVDLGNMNDTFITNDFERQVYALLTSKMVSGERIIQYIMNDSRKQAIDNYLAGIESAITNISNAVKFESLYTVDKKKTSTTVNKEKQVHPIECDLYIKVKDVDGGPMSLSSFLGDLTVCDPSNIQLVNQKESESLTDREILNGITLGANDMLWMEVAISPRVLRGKLLQLERSFAFWKGHQLPKVAVVCVNGDKGYFLQAAQHIRGLYQSGALEKSNLLNSKVFLFFIFTPNRNVYNSLQTLNDTAKTTNHLLEHLDLRLEQLERTGRTTMNMLVALMILVVTSFLCLLLVVANSLFKISL